MANSMRHWNGHQMCAVDVETTGLDPKLHEIWQLCILPLDSNCEIRRDVIPFNILLKLDYPHLIAEGAAKLNRQKILKAQTQGMDREDAKDLLLEWMKKLNLGYSKYGTPKKIMPLAHNWAFDRAFLQAWLLDLWDEVFDFHYMDTFVVSLFLNDKAAVHAEPPPYQKLDLSWIAHVLGIENERCHDALHDCVTTAAVYRKLINAGWI